MRTKKELIRLLKQAAAADLMRKSANAFKVVDGVGDVLSGMRKSVKANPVSGGSFRARPGAGSYEFNRDAALGPQSVPGGTAGSRYTYTPGGAAPGPQAAPTATAAGAAAARPAPTTAAVARRGGSWGPFLGGAAATAGLGASVAGLAGIRGALGDQDSYDRTWGLVNQYNPEWDPYRFDLKFRRAGQEQGPLSQLGLFFSQPINTLRQLAGNAPKFDPMKIDRYGDFVNRSVMPQANGSYISAGHWQPSEDYKWLMENSRNFGGYGLPQGSANSPIVQQYLQTLNNDVG